LVLATNSHVDWPKFDAFTLSQKNSGVASFRNWISMQSI
jgi:hypothetical protein